MLAQSESERKRIKVLALSLPKGDLSANTIEPESVAFESILLWIFKLMDAYGCKPGNPKVSGGNV